MIAFFGILLIFVITLFPYSFLFQRNVCHVESGLLHFGMGGIKTIGRSTKYFAIPAIRIRPHGLPDAEEKADCASIPRSSPLGQLRIIILY